MTIQDVEVMAANKQLVLDLFERVFNQRDLDFADTIVDPAVVDHNPAPGAASGVEGLKERVRLDATAFPDYHMQVDDIFAERDCVVARISWTGTHLGSFGPFEATQRPIKGTGITIFRMRNGRITDRWAAIDVIGLLRQMGVIPEPVPGSPV